MIDGLDDILNILNADQEQRQVNLIIRDNDLTRIVYELLDMGYSPYIEYKAGKISGIMLKFNNTKLAIKTQQLAPDEMDGDIIVNTEEKFNKMNAALAEFNKLIFKTAYKIGRAHV